MNVLYVVSYKKLISLFMLITSACVAHLFQAANGSRLPLNIVHLRLPEKGIRIREIFCVPIMLSEFAKNLTRKSRNCICDSVIVSHF